MLVCLNSYETLFAQQKNGKITALIMIKGKILEVIGKLISLSADCQHGWLINKFEISMSIL